MERKRHLFLFVFWLIGFGPLISASLSAEGPGREAAPAGAPGNVAAAAAGEAALDQQALAAWEAGDREQARQLWLKIAEGAGEAGRSPERDVQLQVFAADQLQRHGFPLDALRLAGQILNTDRASLPEGSGALLLIEQTERQLARSLRNARAGDVELPEAEEEQVLAMLTGLLFDEDTEEDEEIGLGLSTATTTAIAESVVAFAKSTGQLSRLRQSWDAHPKADSLKLLALRAEAAMTEGDQQVADRLLARIRDLEQSTGKTAPVWSPALLLEGLDEKLEAEFRHDLHGSELDKQVFRVGPKLRDNLETGPNGLHFRAPPGTPALTLMFTPILRGDFEVTASYTIPAGPQPRQIRGSGAILRVWNDDNKRQLAGFFGVNGLPADEGGRYVMNRGYLETGNNDIWSESVPTSARSGTLRVVRKGATLYFLAAENGKPEFRRLHQIPFTAEDISGVRVGVHTVDPEIGMEVAWKDLVVRAEQIAGIPGAEQIVGAPGEALPPGAVSRPTAWPWWLLVLFVLSLAGAGIWRLTRGKRAPSD